MLGRLAQSCSTWRAAADRKPRPQPPRLGRLARGRGGADDDGQALPCSQHRGLRQAGSSLVPGSFGLRCALDGRCLGPSGRDGRFLSQPLTLGAQESRSDAPVVGRDRCHGSRRGAGATVARPSGLAGLWPCPAPARSGRTSAPSVAQPPVLMAEEVEGAVEGRDDLTTVYWHVVDHVRRKGRWEPPLKST